MPTLVEHGTDDLLGPLEGGQDHEFINHRVACGKCCVRADAGSTIGASYYAPRSLGVGLSDVAVAKCIGFLWFSAAQVSGCGNLG